MQVKQEFSQPEQVVQQPAKSVTPDTPSPAPLTTPQNCPSETHVSEKEKDLIAADQQAAADASHGDEFTPAYQFASQPNQAPIYQGLPANYYQYVQAVQPMYGHPGHYHQHQQSLANLAGRMYGSGQHVMVMPMPLYHTQPTQFSQQVALPTPAAGGVLSAEVGNPQHQRYPQHQAHSHKQSQQNSSSRATSRHGNTTHRQAGGRSDQSASSRGQPVPAAGESEDGLDVPTIFKTPNRQRVVVWSYCQFCQNNREPEEVYR